TRGTTSMTLWQPERLCKGCTFLVHRQGSRYLLVRVGLLKERLMPTSISFADLTTRIQQLLEECQEHVDALVRIDQTLAGVGAALGNVTSTQEGNPGSAPAPVAAAQ